MIGGGHDWFGVWGNMDIHASVEVWKFFSKYDIYGLIENNTFISEASINDNHLVKVTDILGREVNEQQNTPLFYFYSDGKVRKRIIIE